MLFTKFNYRFIFRYLYVILRLHKSTLTQDDTILMMYSMNIFVNIHAIHS